MKNSADKQGNVFALFIHALHLCLMECKMQKGRVINACGVSSNSDQFPQEEVNVLQKSRINDATCATMSRVCLGCLTALVEIFRYKKTPSVCEL